MNCPDEKTIGMFVDGILPETKRMELSEHMQKCGRCGNIYNEIVRINELTKMSFDAPEERYLNELSLKIKGRYKQEFDNTETRISRIAAEIFWFSIEAAALFLIACAVSFILFASKPSVPSDGHKSMEMQIKARTEILPEKPVADILKEKERTLAKLF